MVVEPLLNSLRTQSRSFCCLSPWIHIAGYPSRRMSRVNSSAFLWREKWKYERLSSFLACRQSYYFIFMALVVYISKYLLYIHKVVVCLVFMKIPLNFFQNFFFYFYSHFRFLMNTFMKFKFFCQTTLEIWENYNFNLIVCVCSVLIIKNSTCIQHILYICNIHYNGN